MTDSNEITRKFFDNILLEMRHIDAVKPDTSITIFGEKFDSPVATAALSHMNNQTEDGMAKMECPVCKLCMVSKQKSRRHETIDIYAPVGQVALN